MTWEEALDVFQEYMAAKAYALRTQEGYLRDVGKCTTFLSRGGIPLHTVTRGDLVAYQTHLCTRKPPLSAKTLSIKLTAIRCFFGFLTKERILLLDPSAQLPLPKVVRGLPRGILSLREMNRLLSTPDVTTPLGIRNRAILELLYSSGLRNTELRTLDLSDLDLERLEVRVRGKGGKPRIVPLGEDASDWLERYVRTVRLLGHQDTPTLFLTCSGKPFGRVTLSFLIRTIAKDAGLKKKIACHALRHTCATHLLRGHADLRSIQELLGHKLLSTTQQYTRVEISDLKRVHARCHPRGRRRL